jgi:hypothetical protein
MVAIYDEHKLHQYTDQQQRKINITAHHTFSELFCL